MPRTQPQITRFAARRHSFAAVAVTLIGVAAISACAADNDGPALTVDGIEISHKQFAALHTDVDVLNDDERAGSAVVLVLREAMVRNALADLNVELSAEIVQAALDEKLAVIEARGNIDDVLGAQNRTRERLQLEAELDTLRTEVAAALVRSERGGFDIDAAYLQYLLAHAEVCIKQMQFAVEADFDVARARLDAGENFGSVARDLSIHPFVQRDEGVGAGGDLGCSPPSALPPGLAEATISAPLGEAIGPVVSSVGLHLLWVDDRTIDELDAVRDQVLEQAVPVQGPELFNAWAIAVLQDADVVVDDAYGTWGVLPETDPVPTVAPAYRSADIIAA
ncbi:peptidylprolyl isomerase [uncultured Ilumatobacter sp.]|jgi:parvulin-like peptidyl-prolyl isomerase|uniref:peptidylprolyl isomerase n=1 Tax=uncultured Ilumatobacter sp. TaxID=879968 RepID=UPI00374F7B66|tara:strand:- start:5167 stop:6177 length:1011 start_codon:yes stop_codon:yes gene_type:complete